MYRRSLDTTFGHPSISSGRLFNQHFGNPLFDDQIVHPPCTNINAPWLLDHRPRRLHNAQESGCSEVQCDKDKFSITLDTNQFLPEEVTVKTVDKYVIVEGRHEEKEDDHGWVTRCFKRKYLLPEDCVEQADHIQCHLSTDGVLQIKVPRVPAIQDSTKEKVLPIKHTGQPAYLTGSNKPTKHIGPNTEEKHNGACDKQNGCDMDKAKEIKDEKK